MNCTCKSPPKIIDRRAMLRPVTSGLVLMVLLAGCGTSQNTVDYGYGKKSGSGFANSLNGTRVFAKMFEKREYRVESRPIVTPTMGEADTVVWFPNHLSPPKKEVIDKLKIWLEAEPNRVLVYVGRDYDAEVPYWTESLKKAKPDQVDKFRRRYAIAKARELERVGKIPNSTIFEDIRFNRLASPQTINAYQGPLADGAITLDEPITIRQTLSWAGTTENDPYSGMDGTPQELLSAGELPLVTAIPTGFYGESRIILVSNGSFLLNYPLAKPQNRQLAVNLLNEIDSFNVNYNYNFFGTSSNRKVIFLESNPEVRESEQPERAKTLWDWIQIAPFNFVIPHLAVLSVIACCYLFPIFGRPKRSDQDSPHDFGKHITAYADMLKKTGNRQYAQQMIDTYRNQKNRARVHHE